MRFQKGCGCMNKHRMFLFLFSGISVIRVLINLFFEKCYFNQHIWLIYISYFLVIGVVLIINFPTVPLEHSVKRVECIMLGNGTLTQEIFDKRRYGGFSLICETKQGRAYSSDNGEMIYTKSVLIKDGNDDTVLSLLVYVFLYTFAGLCIYEIIEEVIQGTFDIKAPINLLNNKLKTLNILSDQYAVVKKINYAWSCIKNVGENFIQILRMGFHMIMEEVMP